MAKHNEFGRAGEQLAVEYLQRKGYEIVARNYRYLKAEIDVIAKMDDILCIVEVKSRNSGFIKDILHSIGFKKIRLITMAADNYVVSNNLDVEVRFDIITIVQKNGKTSVKHLRNAFRHF